MLIRLIPLPPSYNASNRVLGYDRAEVLIQRWAVRGPNVWGTVNRAPEIFAALLMPQYTVSLAKTMIPSISLLGCRHCSHQGGSCLRPILKGHELVAELPSQPQRRILPAPHPQGARTHCWAAATATKEGAAVAIWDVSQLELIPLH